MKKKAAVIAALMACMSTNVYAAAVRGDADQSGNVDLLDAIAVTNYSEGNIELNDLSYSDVNNDGAVDKNDAALILRSAAGLAQIPDAVTHEIVLADNNITADGKSTDSVYVKIDNTANTITIISPGTYAFSGSLSDGQIIVDIPDSYSVNNAELEFNGISVSNSSGPAVYGINGDIKISAKKGTINTLSDGTPTVFETETAEDGTITETDEPNGCIFSHDGLSFKGKGALTVNGNYSNGISGKDEVEIKNLTLTVNAPNNAIKAKDYVSIESGTIELNALPDSTADTENFNYDGIHCTKGYADITGGNITINSYCDGIQAADHININGEAVINITTTGVITASSSSQGSQWGGFGGYTNNETADISAKGIKSDTDLTIDGGANITVNSTDDSLHTNGTITITNADITLSAGDDGVHADDTLTINDGCTLNVTKSYEGIEAEKIYINGGECTIYSSDDNINAAGGNDGSSSGGFDQNADGYIEINGGYVYCENSVSEGDGVDSNGKIYMNGGVLLVNGPTSNGDTAIDTGDKSGDGFYYNGGTVFSVGSSGMAESPTASDGYIVTYGIGGSSTGGHGGMGGSRPGQQGGSSSGSTYGAGTQLTLADASGNVAAAFTVKTTAQAIIIGSDLITAGNSYTLYSGGAYSGTLDENGYASGGTITGGTKIASGTVSNKVTSLS